MGINIGWTHKTVNIGVCVSITDTGFDIIINIFFSTESNTVRISVKTFGFGGIVQLGFVEHSLNPHCTTFEDIVTGRHTLCTGWNRAAGQACTNRTKYLISCFWLGLLNHRRNFGSNRCQSVNIGFFACGSIGVIGKFRQNVRYLSLNRTGRIIQRNTIPSSCSSGIVSGSAWFNGGIRSRSCSGNFVNTVADFFKFIAAVLT